MIYRFADLQMDIGRRSLTRGDERLKLTKLNFKVLEALINAAPNLISQNELINHIWGADRIISVENLAQRIAILRQTLSEDVQRPVYIETVYGQGFRLIPEVTMLPSKSNRPPTQPLVPNSQKQNNELKLLPPQILGHEKTNSTAVLPFMNRSSSVQDGYFVDGLHDDLLTLLSKIGSIKIISRTSVMQYRDTRKTIPQIAKELGVNTILEGTVQRAGANVRVNVQLINATSDAHIWAEIYERELTASNIFAIQSEIASAITKALQATLSQNEQNDLMLIPTQSLPALEAYFQGKQQMQARHTDSFVKAVKFFQQAIKHDANFALAHVALADSYTMQIDYSGFEKFEMARKSEAAIKIALAVNDRLGEAYASLGRLKRLTEYRNAEVHFRHALELNPNYANAHLWYSSFLRRSGRFSAALEHIRMAAELDPLSVIITHNLGRCYESLSMIDEAQTQYNKNIEHNPEFPLSYGSIAGIYCLSYGQLDKSYFWIKKGLALDPNNNETLYWMGVFCLDLGDDKHAEDWFSKLQPNGPFTNRAYTFLMLYRGEQEKVTHFGSAILKTSPSSKMNIFLYDQDLKAGSYDLASKKIASVAPLLIEEKHPTIDSRNFAAAIKLSSILLATGEHQRANILLEQSFNYVSTTDRLGAAGTGIADVQIYALQGKVEQALTTLRQAIDEGWRTRWWYYLKIDFCLYSLRNEPTFQIMVKEVEADMAGQLRNVNEVGSAEKLEPNSR